jgi:CAAX protease family protein
MDAESTSSQSRREILIVTVLTLPFLLNDFANIFVKDYRLWLAIDYIATKAFPLALISYLLRARRMSFADIGVRPVSIGAFVGWTLALTLLGLLLDQFGSRFFAALLPNTRLGRIPAITNPVIEQFDLCFGLAFVGVVEEIIFRGFYFTVLKRHLPSLIAVFMISSFVFGLIHWSLGLSAIVHTGLIGAVFMTVMWKTGSVLPAIVAHFLVDYVAFSSLLNKLGLV